MDKRTIFPNYNEYPYGGTGLEFATPAQGFRLVNVPFGPPDPDPSGYGGSRSFMPSTTLSLRERVLEPSSGRSLEGLSCFPLQGSDSSDPVLKYISQMLLEENMENKPHMFFDPLALKATEKSLYDTIGERYPSALNTPQLYINHESPSSDSSGNSSVCGANGIPSTSSSSPGTGSTDFHDPKWAADHEAIEPADLLQSYVPGSGQPQMDLLANVQLLKNCLVGFSDITDGIMGSSATEMVQNMLNNRESMLQFKRGIHEASKFLPTSNQLVPNEVSTKVVAEENFELEIYSNGSRGRKNHWGEDSDLEEWRSNKQSAISTDETDLSEMFDKVLLWPGIKGTLCNQREPEQNGEKNILQPDEQPTGRNVPKARGRKKGKKKETVDLRALLILCSHSISANDFRTANELLKQIRQHTCPSGDGSQRVAHYFADCLEARLVGNGTKVENVLSLIAVRRTSPAVLLKAYKTHLNACPFKKLNIFFANKMILDAAEKATTLHIVDFGVLYGFQWPVLIQLLSMRSGGPPKLRITGIELPQSGFRPTERIEETGRRLAKYCERFNVPFDYNPIVAKDWENIPIEELRIRSNEVLAVNCSYRFKNLFDETAEGNCPRDAVLKLIRKMHPAVFVHCITNGSYNAPFFVTRFREALFHFSSLFDIFESTLPRGNEERVMFEREFCAREAMNVLACEGLDRVERPETYKQWQTRTVRAGFQLLPLNQKLIEQFKDMLKGGYHKDFIIDEDGQWMLQGWKGRIIYASSCWVPA
ncbi:hypothetical protein K2173_015640 [Erythroxylum novogranatense]|uniref:Scarecrow-like protein 33 n=1 Tax=Erythroxylum novogranatense TaxID=1862640 RepID=A0AAV8SEZ2_9ROSI|nr:hypothetical protein K2173_015640 [Erythroxylum novogranatense]